METIPNLLFALMGMYIGLQGIVKIIRRKVKLKDDFWLYNPIDYAFLTIIFNKKEVQGGGAILIGIIHLLFFDIWSYNPLKQLLSF